MIIRNEQTTFQCDSELANRRLNIVVGYLERLRREKEALENQNKVLSSANSGLQDYFKKFKFDPKEEQENIAKAMEETEEDLLSEDAMGELEGIENLDTTGMGVDIDFPEDN